MLPPTEVSELQEFWRNSLFSPCPSHLHFLPTATAVLPTESFPPPWQGEVEQHARWCHRPSKLLRKDWQSRTRKRSELIHQHSQVPDKGLRITRLGHGHEGSHGKNQQVLWRKKQMKGQLNTLPVICNTSSTGAKGESSITWALQLCNT